MLRERGVTCTPGHPFVVGWAQQSVPDETLIEAVERARLRKPAPEPIPIAYLAPIVEEVITGPPAPVPKAKPDAWWLSDTATEAKGRSIGLHPRGGESFEEYRARIRQKLKAQESRA
jgi:hypothetical protein